MSADPGETSVTVQGTLSKGVTLPSSIADYLSNPPPTYPALSLRLGEQGKVMVRVQIGKNGRALQARVAESSGFDRLDQAALRAVLNWRYVPGTVDGQAQDMWFDAPINFKQRR
jgi:protein TonB